MTIMFSGGDVTQGEITVLKKEIAYFEKCFARLRNDSAARSKRRAPLRFLGLRDGAPSSLNSCAGGALADAGAGASCAGAAANRRLGSASAGAAAVFFCPPRRMMAAPRPPSWPQWRSSAPRAARSLSERQRRGCALARIAHCQAAPPIFLPDVGRLFHADSGARGLCVGALELSFQALFTLLVDSALSSLSVQEIGRAGFAR